MFDIFFEIFLKSSGTELNSASLEIIYQKQTENDKNLEKVRHLKDCEISAASPDAFKLKEEIAEV